MKQSLFKRFVAALKGGKGSGNFGHAGVPGRRGGSAPKGGAGGGAATMEPPNADRALREGADIGDIREVADDLYEYALDDEDTAQDLVEEYLNNLPTERLANDYSVLLDEQDKPTRANLDAAIGENWDDVWNDDALIKSAATYAAGSMSREDVENYFEDME